MTGEFYSIFYNSIKGFVEFRRNDGSVIKSVEMTDDRWNEILKCDFENKIKDIFNG